MENNEDVMHLSLEQRLQLKKEGFATSQDAKLKKKKEKVEEKKIQPRDNKNRPREMTSKRQVGRFREVVSLKKSVRRDPRFDSLSGKFNSDLFNKTYSFLQDYKDSEIEAIKQKLKKTKDSSTVSELQTILTTLQQERANHITQSKINQVTSKRKRAEREAVEAGKGAYYMKRKDKKNLILEARFEELKESGKLEKFMMKKRKKNASKDHRWLPTQRKENL